MARSLAHMSIGNRNHYILRKDLSRHLLDHLLRLISDMVEVLLGN